MGPTFVKHPQLGQQGKDDIVCVLCRCPSVGEAASARRKFGIVLLMLLRYRQR